MKQDYEKLMRDALRAEEEPSEELDQKLMEKFKERDSMKKGKWNGKRVAAAVAAISIVLLGGTATVNAVTDGGVEKVINKFFNSIIISSSNDEQSFLVYQDEDGNNVVQSGQFSDMDIDDIPDETLSEKDKEAAKDNYDTGIIFKQDDKNSPESIHYETNSDKQHAIFNLKIGEDTHIISTNFEDWMDDEDKTWQLRQTFNESAVKDNLQEYIKELQKIKEKSKEDYVKQAITQAMKDLKSDNTIYIGRYDVPASDLDKNAKDADKIMDAAWFKLQHDNLEFKDGKAEIVCDSVAGYKMKCKCTIKKNEEGNYYIDDIESVK